MYSNMNEQKHDIEQGETTTVVTSAVNNDTQ